MKIVTIKEKIANENRVAISPDICKLLISQGHEIIIEQSCGISSGFKDQNYIDAGAKVLNTVAEVVHDADIILKVQALPVDDGSNELDFAKAGAVIIGLLSPYTNPKYLKQLATKNLSALAMELVPRTTKAQSMDALSSQANLAGYRAVIEASYYFSKAFPMMMTAAGTVNPAKILILGVGVAGLQAIATAKRLGAVVTAYDIRSVTKEQVESLGAKFVSFEETVNLENASGYANETSDEYKARQSEFLANLVKNFDIIITTAQIPGKPAPRLLDKNMVSSLKTGSVIIDMNTSSGGNVEGSVKDQIVDLDGVKIIGWSNLAAKIPNDASRLYARNIFNILNILIKNNECNFDEEIINQILVIHNGNIVEKFKDKI